MVDQAGERRREGAGVGRARASRAGPVRAEPEAARAHPEHPFEGVFEAVGPRDAGAAEAGREGVFFEISHCGRVQGTGFKVQAGSGAPPAQTRRASAFS